MQEILLKGRPGKFEMHPKLEEFVILMKKIEIVESDRELSAKKGQLKLE